MAGSYLACQVVCIDYVLQEIKFEVRKPIVLQTDNKSVITLARNFVSHGRSKHIEIRFYFLREQVNNGMLKVIHCSTEKTKLLTY